MYKHAEIYNNVIVIYLNDDILKGLKDLLFD